MDGERRGAWAVHTQTDHETLPWSPRFSGSHPQEDEKEDGGFVVFESDGNEVNARAVARMESRIEDVLDTLRNVHDAIRFEMIRQRVHAYYTSRRKMAHTMAHPDFKEVPVAYKFVSNAAAGADTSPADAPVPAQRAGLTRKTYILLIQDVCVRLMRDLHAPVVFDEVVYDDPTHEALMNEARMPWELPMDLAADIERGTGLHVIVERREHQRIALRVFHDIIVTQ